MRLLPRSLYGRLAMLGALATLAALAVAGIAIGAVLERVVLAGLDQRLDGEIATLAAAVAPDGTVDRARLVAAPPFDGGSAGWGWTITLPDGARLGSGEALPVDLLTSGPPPPPPGSLTAAHHPPPLGPPGDGHPFDWRDPATGMVHGRARAIVTTQGVVTIVATAPRALIERPLRQALTPLLVSLLLLGLALTLATLVQLRLGLAPLTRLRTALGEVRAGRAAHITRDQPTELTPLTDELNALLDENAAALANARAATANLAHGLKTPLATLTLELAQPGRDPDGKLTALAARIDQAVRHHLGRARIVAGGGPARAATPLGATLDDLVAALARLHPDRRIVIDIATPPGLALAIDPQDLDELLGNLLDNAWRWARATIRVTATVVTASAQAIIVIDDDGPGIPEAARAQAVVPGRRLDERGDGHGFGLAIAQELAALYGGRLTLDRADLGGLRAVTTLPLAAHSITEAEPFRDM